MERHKEVAGLKQFHNFSVENGRHICFGRIIGV